MPGKPTPPPVAGLYHRKNTEPVLIMQGSKATSPSNCLALAWPYPKPTEEKTRQSPSGSGDRMIALAERRNDHTSMVVSPSGQPVVRVQSSYQGFFTPEKFYSGSPRMSSPYGGFTITSTPQSRRLRGEDRMSSFISLDGSTSTPARSRRSPVIPPRKQTSPGLSPLLPPSSSTDESKGKLPSSERILRFQGGNAAVASRNSPASVAGDLDFSPGHSRQEESGYREMSTSSLYSPGDSPNWLFDRRIRGRNSSYRTVGRSSPLRWLCQGLCWWLATIMVIVILCINLSFVYFDYQASNINVEPSKRVSLKTYLTQHLISQPIAINEISWTFDGFLLASDNRSSLVLSFHGGVGVGKSFTSDLLQKYYFGTGVVSDCVSIFSVPIYASHQEETVRGTLNEWLKVSDKSCPIHFYVLEDLHGYTSCRIVTLIQEALESFLGEKLDGKHAVIIITNIAAVQIMQDALYNLETNMKGNLNPMKFRSSIRLSWKAIDDFEQNDRHHVEGIDATARVTCSFSKLSELIDVSVPFLPMERNDVKQCTRDIASGKGWVISKEQEAWVADQLVYEPSHWPVYSTSGCKQVAEKLGLIHNVGVI